MRTSDRASSPATEEDSGAGPVGPTGEAPAGPPARTSVPDRVPQPSARRPAAVRAAAAVLVIGLVVVGLLTWVSRLDYNHTEERLLDLKAREAALVLTEALPSVQTPLASAAALADATQGSKRQLDRFIKSYVGKGKSFVSVSLWRLGSPGSGPVAVEGSTPFLAAHPARATAFFDQARRSPGVSVTGVLTEGGQRHLGYEYQQPGPSGQYAAYAESTLPSDTRTAKVNPSSPFADLHYALYLGAKPGSRQLLETDLAQLPMTGRHATALAPFGDTSLTVMVSAKDPLVGWLPKNLPWLIASSGVLLVLAGTALTDRLVRRRHRAEQLAADLEQLATDNRRLYTEQRSIAQTLQQALLPDDLPAIAGLVSACRYLPGVAGIEVGGDWYDLIPYDDGRALLVIGDVSGRGLQAARIMARLQYAVRAYAAQADPPGAILEKLSGLLSVERDGHFATVLCAELDVANHRVALSNAGHLPLLRVDGGRTAFVDAQVGVPVGVSAKPRYETSTFATAPGTVLIGYTDGLVERRDEDLDVGLERLREVAGARPGSLAALMTAVEAGLLTTGAEDDTAIVGVAWAG